MPFAECSENENGHDCGATSSDERSDENSETDRNGAVAGILDVDQSESDQPSREAAQKNADEGQNASDWRGEGGQRALIIHGAIVGGTAVCGSHSGWNFPKAFTF